MKAKLNIIADEKWTPVARGGVYCSPRCGYGCTRAAYERAVKEADILTKRMGAGWEPEIWENGGWHHAINKGVARIVPSVRGSTISGVYKIDGYSCYLNSAKQVVTDAKTPEDALGFAVQTARGIERQIAADLEFIGSA
jgi:hypothetical protein